MKYLTFPIKSFIWTLLLFFGCLYAPIIVAQQYSEETIISIITCEPGEELYSSFGHNAIRLKDPTRSVDMVYNYGLFDFNTPNFYSKFVSGKLLYKLGRTNYNRFIREYQIEGRKVTEQQLNLDKEATTKLIKLLKENYLPENRYYQYDFLYDNCATRIRDLVEKSLSKKLHYPSAVNTTLPTFRQLLDPYLITQAWTHFGIDLILGLPADKRASITDQMFLPDYLLKYTDKATILTEQGYENLVKETITLNEGNGNIKGVHTFSPLLAFAVVLMWVLWITFGKKRERVVRVFDYVFFGVLGLVGLILIAGWLGTDHEVMAYNLNILWANPIYFYLLWALWKKKAATIRQVAKVILFLNLVIFVLLPVFPQQFNIGVLPIFVLIMVRTWHLGYRQPKIKNAE